MSLMDCYIQLESDEGVNERRKWCVAVFTDIIEKLGAKNIQVIVVCI